MTTSIKTDSENLLERLCEEISEAKSDEEKISILHSFEQTQKFLNENFIDFSPFSLKEKCVLLMVIALGQGGAIAFASAKTEDLRALASRLIAVEYFYREIGGIIGYQLLCLRLSAEKHVATKKGTYHPPKAHDLAKKGASHDGWVQQGIEELDKLAEIYPIGGAADRLSKKKFQVAATFIFDGKTLIQRLIEDLQAREYLYYKMFGKQIAVPLVMMTSEEKEGDFQIRNLFEEKNWFGRKKENCFFFSQPLVPAMTEEGKWCSEGPGKLLFKPGGHGVIWKLARDCGALKWLKERGKTKALLRQINNVAAGVDDGLLAFLGIGFAEGKDFGFAACPRQKGLSEGVDVVIETEQGFCLTNIEYCDFEHFQVDEDAELLANTNLLFVDLKTAEKLLEKNPIPGMLVNAKKMNGKKAVMRLESTMQNLADGLVDKKPQQRSFITSNVRRKTISSIKRQFVEGRSLSQTPEQCFLDMQENARELLALCGFSFSPDVIFRYHPALGPLYSVIAKKLRGGHLAKESQLTLEIAEVEIENLQLAGKLEIKTKAVMGHTDEKGFIRYSDQAAKCTLKNVTVRNKGDEKCVIEIEEGGVFVAENLYLEGNQNIVVPKRNTD